MRFLDLVRRRQSDRGYTTEPIERDAIEQCLEAARLAPSACNSQPWFFVVVDDPQLRAKVASHCRDLVMNHFVTTAPVLIAVVAETPPLIPRLAGHLKDKQYHLMDVAIAAEHFCLQAAEQGLGTCMIGWFDERGVKGALGIPRNRRVPLIIALGHPKDTTIRTKLRKDLDEIRRHNGYRGAMV